MADYSQDSRTKKSNKNESVFILSEVTVYNDWRQRFKVKHLTWGKNLWNFLWHIQSISSYLWAYKLIFINDIPLNESKLLKSVCKNIEPVKLLLILKNWVWWVGQIFTFKQIVLSLWANFTRNHKILNHLKVEVNYLYFNQ